MRISTPDLYMKHSDDGRTVNTIFSGYILASLYLRSKIPKYLVSSTLGVKSEDTDKSILVYFYPYLWILHQAWN